MCSLRGMRQYFLGRQQPACVIACGLLLSNIVACRQLSAMPGKNQYIVAAGQCTALDAATPTSSGVAAMLDAMLDADMGYFDWLINGIVGSSGDN